MASLSDKVAIQYSSRVLVQGFQILDGIQAHWLSSNDMATFGLTCLITDEAQGVANVD